MAAFVVLAECDRDDLLAERSDRDGHLPGVVAFLQFVAAGLNDVANQLPRIDRRP